MAEESKAAAGGGPPPAPPGAAAGDDSLGAPAAHAALLSYLEACGGSHSRIALRGGGAGGTGGVFAAEDVRAGDVLMEVPFSACLSVEGARARVPALSALLEDPAAAALAAQPDEVLAVALMHARLSGAGEASPPSPWAALAAAVPASFDTPVFWDDEELELLRGTAVHALTGMMRAQLARDWEELHAPLAAAHPGAYAGAGLGEYRWAMAAVYSRAFGFARRGEYVRALAPVLDMLNHHHDAAASLDDLVTFDDATDALRFRAGRDVAAGGEVLAKYGDYCNAKLLYSYGFVEAGNPLRAADWWTRVAPGSRHAQQKATALRTTPLTANQTYDFAGTLRGPGYVAPALLATVRVVQAADDEMHLLGRAFRGEAITPRNEAASYTALRAQLQRSLEAAPTTLEEDRAALVQLAAEGGDPAGRRGMALRVVMEHKELLHGTVELLTRWLDDLARDPEGYVPPDHPSRDAEAGAEDAQEGAPAAAAAAPPVDGGAGEEKQSFP